MCSHLADPEKSGVQLLMAISDAVNVYVNYTGTATCYNTERQAEKSLGDKGWDFQVIIMDFDDGNCSLRITSVI